MQKLRDLSVATTSSDSPHAQCGLSQPQNNGFPVIGLAPWGTTEISSLMSLASALGTLPFLPHPSLQQFCSKFYR